MTSSFNNRRVRLGALVGMGAILTLAIGLGVFAGSGDAARTAAPINTAPPTITGKAEKGEKLVGNRGTWSNEVGDYNDQWVRCDKDGGSCSNISGATDRTGYVLKGVDVGATIRFKVEAKNGDGTTVKSSVPTAVIADTKATPPPTANGCPAGTGTIPIAELGSPARLVIDTQQANPRVVGRDTRQVTVRYHVSACGGRNVQGALVYATAVPFNQLSIPPEQPTGSDGWVQLDFRMLQGYPVSAQQQLIAMFVRTRKPGESVLGGISSRRLFSVAVNLKG